MLAILDLHWNSKINTGSCSAGQQPMADAPRAITLWQQVAARFKDNPLVAFDLYNEPHDISWNVWRDGGLVFELTGVWRAAGMQQMYNAVRATGATNLVFVTGLKWGNTPPPKERLLSGYNIVYATHWYGCPTSAALRGECKASLWDSAAANDPAPPGKRLDTWTPLSQTAPVAVTEFGWPEHKDGIWNQRVIDWAESRGASWMGFTWNPNTPFALIGDWISYTPTPAGVPVKNGVALNF